MVQEEAMFQSISSKNPSKEIASTISGGSSKSIEIQKSIENAPENLELIKTNDIVKAYALALAKIFSKSKEVVVPQNFVLFKQFSQKQRWQFTTKPLKRFNTNIFPNQKNFRTVFYQLKQIFFNDNPWFVA